MTATKKTAPVLEHRDGQRVEKKHASPLHSHFTKSKGVLQG